MTVQHNIEFNRTFQRRRWLIRLTIAIGVTLITLFISVPILGKYALLISLLLLIGFFPNITDKRPALSWNERGICWHYRIGTGILYEIYTFIHWKNIASLEIQSGKVTLYSYSGTAFVDFPDKDEPIPRNIGEPCNKAVLTLTLLAGEANVIASHLLQSWTQWHQPPLPTSTSSVTY